MWFNISIKYLKSKNYYHVVKLSQVICQVIWTTYFYGATGFLLRVGFWFDVLLTLVYVLICSGTLHRRQVTVGGDRQLLCHLILTGSGIQGLSVYVKMNPSFVCSGTKCKNTVAPFSSTVQNFLWHHPDAKYINEDEQNRTGLWWHPFNCKLLSMFNKNMGLLSRMSHTAVKMV